MANISSANETLTLKGDWTEAAVEALKPVLDAWKFYGEYGMRVYEYPTVDKTTIEFNGSGRWSFSGTLGDFDSWTRSWIKDQPERNGEPIRPLATEQYDLLLKLMQENALSMEVDFEDKEGGMGLRNHEVGVFTSEDGELHYERMTCEAVLSDDSGSEATVGYLAQFCTNPDTEKLSEWVADNICFTDIFDNWAPDHDQIIYELQEFLEDPFPQFSRDFSPDTKAWEEFCEIYKSINDYRPDEVE